MQNDFDYQALGRALKGSSELFLILQRHDIAHE
jgi:hypothetical protein